MLCRLALKKAGIAVCAVACVAALAPCAAFAQEGEPFAAGSFPGFAASCPADTSIVQLVADAVATVKADAAAVAEAAPLSDEVPALGNARPDDQLGGQVEEAEAVSESPDSQAHADASAFEAEEGGAISLSVQAMANDSVEQQAGQEGGGGETAQDGALETQATESHDSEEATANGVSAQDETSNTGSTSNNSTGNSTSSGHKPPLAGAQTISWANTADDAKKWFNDEKAVLANGTAEVVSVKLPDADGGATMTAAELASANTSSSAYYLNGVLKAPANSTITMKLLPARGYQLLTSTINGGLITVKALTDEKKIGQYTFSMPTTSEGLALDCGFTAYADKIVSSSPVVTGGSISNANTAIKSGTLALTIEDVDDSDTKKEFNAKASSGSVVAYIDTTLDNIVAQGSEAKVWEDTLLELPQAVTVTLKLSDSAVSGASQFYVIREYDDNYQQASVTYDSSAKSITFNTDKFSTYAIVKGTPSNSSGGSGSSTPKTGDTNNVMPFCVSAVLSAAIAAFSARRLRRSQ